MEMTGAKILMECLLEQGVDLVFGYPGGQVKDFELLTQAQAAQADLHPDGVVNGLDLCRMRQVLNG